MSIAKQSKSRLLMVLALAAAGLLVVCCVAAVVLFMPAESDSVSFDQPMPTEIQETVPLETEEVVEEPAPTSESVEAPNPEVQPVAPQGEMYVHPQLAFQVQSFGDRQEEGENYVTFYDEENILDLTIFDVNGSLSQNNLERIAAQVLQAVLVDTEWAAGFTLTKDTPVQVNNGYVVYFRIDGASSGQTEGALFLQQNGSSLAALTLLTPSVNQNNDAFMAEAESFIPSGGQAAQQPPVAPPAQGEDAAAAFDVKRDGFSFENYGNQRGIQGLTSTEMKRMFGEKVCASISGDKCTLKPAAKSWMQQANAAMSGGHCEGMAVLSQLFYYGQEQPDEFGAPQPFDLSLNNNQALQREIAYWWVTQSTRPGGLRKVNGSPREVVETLRQSFSQGKDAQEWWVVGIYMRDGSGGHAITPIGVEDVSADQTDILVYDNNWPGEVRRIEVNMRKNAWYYLAAVNPSETEAVYEGDSRTQTLEIVAISPRLNEQVCTFCGGRGAVAQAPEGPRSLSIPQYYEIYLEGRTDLLITDEAGNQIGYLDGELINTIPDAAMDTFRFGMDVWDVNYEPVYKIPVGTTFGVSVVGANITEPSTATVTIIGPGFYMSIADILMDPGEIDTIGVANDERFFGLVYMTNYTETPIVELGIENDDGSAYAFQAQATELTGEEDTLNVGIDLDSGQFILNSSDNTNPGTYTIDILRLTPEEILAFGTQDLVLDPEATIYLNYLTWPAGDAPMTADVDANSDGTIDETIELPNTSGDWTWE